MIKLLFFLFVSLHSILHACATCQLMTPTAEIQLHLNFNQNKLERTHIEWHFSDVYTAEMLNQYDKNYNSILDKEELLVIQNAMLDYLIPKSMVTKIEYGAKESESIALQAEYKNFQTVIKKEFMVFSYDAILHKDMEEESILSFAFEDDEGYFAFVVTDANASKGSFEFTKNLYLFTASFMFSSGVDGKENSAEVLKQAKVETKEVEQKAEQNTSKEELSTQANLLEETMAKVKDLFTSIKDEKNPLTYLLLLFFAYLYGVIHALGPGHGKTLVASYFLSNERSYAKAFGVSVAIGVVHTFSAFVLTLVIYYIVTTFLAQFLDDTVFFTTKISALIIIFIALYLLWKKYKAYSALEKTKSTPFMKFSTAPHIDTCACASCKVDKNSTDIALIISAGIIPCPGTTTLFIFAISLGLFYAGFLSALVMSMGMSTIIFLSAVLSVFMRKKTLEKNTKLKKYLEYISLSVILILGLVLLFF